MPTKLKAVSATDHGPPTPLGLSRGALFTPASVQRGEATFALSRALRELRAAGDQLAGLQGDGYPAALEEIRRLADGVYAASRRLQRLPLPTGIGSTSTSR